MEPTTQTHTATQESADVADAFAGATPALQTASDDPDAAATPKKKKKKKNILVRFLLGIVKTIIFIIAVIAVSALIFIVFVDNAEVEALFAGIASDLASDAINAVKGLFA